MPIDPRSPVLVGAAQISQRAEDPRDGREPLVLMEDALRAAGDDSGAPGLLGATRGSLEGEGDDDGEQCSAE